MSSAPKVDVLRNVNTLVLSVTAFAGGQATDTARRLALPALAAGQLPGHEPGEVEALERLGDAPGLGGAHPAALFVLEERLDRGVRLERHKDPGEPDEAQEPQGV